MEKDFLKALANQIKAENMAALKIYADYFYGKPQEKVDITTDGKAISITLDLK